MDGTNPNRQTVLPACNPVSTTPDHIQAVIGSSPHDGHGQLEILVTVVGENTVLPPRVSLTRNDVVATSQAEHGQSSHFSNSPLAFFARYPSDVSHKSIYEHSLIFIHWENWPFTNTGAYCDPFEGGAVTNSSSSGCGKFSLIVRKPSRLEDSFSRTTLKFSSRCLAPTGFALPSSLRTSSWNLWRSAMLRDVGQAP